MANFCQSNLFDAESVGLVTTILAKSRKLMPKLEYQDKWPNIDGYIYVLENSIETHKDCSQTLGTIEVQIKKLKENHDNKFSFETDYLRYAQQAINPVILICVDLNEEVLYWKNIDSEFIKSYKDKLTQQTITVNLTENDKITKESQDYLIEWENVIIQKRNKIDGYDKIKNELDSYQVISENSKLIPAKISKEYMNIHRFLDILNNNLDNDFKIIKDVFLPNTWKLGFAFLKYEPQDLSYSLFNIPYDVNDVQIKQIILKGDVKTFMREQNINSFSWSAENLVDKNPKKVALEWIQNKNKELIENKLLKIESFEIMNDFLIEFVTRFSDEFGLEIKDEYSISEIEKHFNKNLLIWIEELYKLRSLPLSSIIPVDLDSGFITPDDSERLILKKSVSKRIEDNDFAKRQFIFSTKHYDFSKFLKFIEYLKLNDLTNLKRNFVLGSKDMSGKKSYCMWEPFSKEEIIANTKYLLNLLPSLHDAMIQLNYPSLFKELKYFKNFNKVFFVIKNLKDDYSGDSRGPCLDRYYINDKSINKNTIEIFTEDEFEWEVNHQNNSLTKEGDELKLFSWGGGVHHDIFHRFPTLNYVYNSVENKINTYIEKLLEENQNVQ